MTNYNVPGANCNFVIDFKTSLFVAFVRNQLITDVEGLVLLALFCLVVYFIYAMLWGLIVLLTEIILTYFHSRGYRNGRISALRPVTFEY